MIIRLTEPLQAFSRTGKVLTVPEGTCILVEPEQAKFMVELELSIPPSEITFVDCDWNDRKSIAACRN